MRRDAGEDVSRINKRLSGYVNREPVPTLRAVNIKVPQVTFPEGQDVPEINATEFEIDHLRSAMASHGRLIITGLSNSMTMADFCRVINLAPRGLRDTTTAK